MRVKYGFLILLLLSATWAFGADITFNWIGMHGRSVADFDASPGETISFKVQYDGSGVLDGVDGTFVGNNSNLGYVALFCYSSAIPDDANYLGSRTATVNSFSATGIGTDAISTFSITLPSVPSGTLSFQAMLGLYGHDGDFNNEYSDRRTSYIVRGSYPICPEAVTDTNFQNYMTYTADTSTTTPTLTYPADASYDNASISVRFNIPETPLSGTVTLYIDDDNNHTNGYFNSLILASSYQSAGTKSFTLDGNNITSSTYVQDCSDYANDILTDGSVYYFAVGYQDAAGNAEAKSAWHSMTYDTTVPAPTMTSATDGAGSNVTLGYHLTEAAYQNKVCFYFRPSTSTSTLAAEICLTSTSNNTAGSYSYTFNASDFTSDSNVTLIAGDALTTGVSYKVTMSCSDAAGNDSGETVSSRTFTYSFDQTTDAPTVGSCTQSSGVTSPTLNVAFTLAEAAASGTVHILIDNDANASNGVLTDIILVDNTAAGAHSLTFHTPITVGSDNVSSYNGSSTIATGSIYIGVSYQDASSNPAATAWGSSLSWDGATNSSGLAVTSVSSGAYYGDVFNIGYTLPEAALNNSGSVLLLVDNDADHSSIYTTLTIQSDFTRSHYYDAGTHTLNNVNWTDIGAHTNVDTADPYNSLTSPDNAPTLYYFAVQYRDAYGNTAVTSPSWVSAYYDHATQQVVLTSPATSASLANPFTLTYTLPETALAGNTGLFLTFHCTSVSETDRVLNVVTHTSGTYTRSLDPTNLTTGGYLASISGTTALTDGETYSLTITTRDLANNTATTATSTGLLYNSSSVAVTAVMGSPAIGTTPLSGASATNQKLLYFTLGCNTGASGTLTSLTATLDGTATAADFGTNPVKLWLDANNNGTLDAGEMLGSSQAFAATVTFSGLSTSINQVAQDFYISIDEAATITMSHYVRAKVTNIAVTASGVTYSGLPITGVNHNLDGYAVVQGEAYGTTTLVASTNNQAIFRVALFINQGSATMTGLSFSMSGTGTATGIPVGGMKLWASTDNAFSSTSDTQIGTANLGATVSFTGLSQALSNTTTYYFLTADFTTGSGAITPSINQNSVTTSYNNNVNPSMSTTFTYTGAEVALPVTLSAFAATNSGHMVTLAWTTQTETDNLGFNVYRGLSSSDLSNGNAMQLNAEVIPGAGTVSVPTNYTYSDDYRIEYGTTYYYWIEFVNLSGGTTTSPALGYTPQNINQDQDPHDVVYGLYSNYPNPFNPRTTIAFAMPAAGTATIEIYNIRGQLVKSLYRGHVQKDIVYRQDWNGTDNSGKDVSSGVYYYRLQCGSFVQQKQMLLMR